MANKDDDYYEEQKDEN